MQDITRYTHEYAAKASYKCTISKQIIKRVFPKAFFLNLLINHNMKVWSKKYVNNLSLYLYDMHRLV